MCQVVPVFHQSSRTVDYLGGHGATFSTSYIAAMQDTAAQPRNVGHQIRERRQSRRTTKLGLALDAEISARHSSFLETGKSQPSREMVPDLCRAPRRAAGERNMLLIATGYAPVFAQRSLDDPALTRRSSKYCAVMNLIPRLPSIVPGQW
jgi:hypothetical protein